MRQTLAAAVAWILSSTSLMAIDQPKFWLSQLFDVNYQIREEAHQRLLEQGPDSLPILRTALAASRDAEFSRRLDEIIKHIEHKKQSQDLTCAPLVSFRYQNVPLRHAIADMRQRTGLNLQLSLSHVHDPERSINAECTQQPIWHALEHFYRCANLHEAPRGESTEVVPENRLPHTVWPWQHRAEIRSDASQNAVIMLNDGLGKEVYADRNSAVRVSFSPAHEDSVRKHRDLGLMVLSFEILPTTSMSRGCHWLQTTGVRVLKAEDARGEQVLPGCLPTRATAPVQTDDFGFFAGVNPWPNNNGFLADPLRTVGADPAVDPRNCSIALQTGDKTIEHLNSIQGVVSGKMSVPHQTLQVIKDMTKPTMLGVGVSVDDPVAIQSYQEDHLGRAIVLLRQANSRALHQGLRSSHRHSSIQSLWDAEILKPFRFLDEKNRIRPSPWIRTVKSCDEVNRNVTEMEIVFDPHPQFGLPRSLEFLGDKVVTVEVPFVLKQISLR